MSTDEKSPKDIEWETIEAIGENPPTLRKLKKRYLDNPEVLHIIRYAQYLEKASNYYAQYYHDPYGRRPKKSKKDC